MTALLCLKVILPAASQAFNSEEEGVGVGVVFKQRTLNILKDNSILLSQNVVAVAI